MIPDLDIWKEKGHDQALKKIIEIEVEGGKLEIHFPKVSSGQAIISAIAIASKDRSLAASPSSNGNIRQLVADSDANKHQVTVESWLDIGDLQFHGSDTKFLELPSQFFGAEWIKSSETKNDTGLLSMSFLLEKNSDVFLAIPNTADVSEFQLAGFSKSDLMLRNTSTTNPDYTIYSKRYPANTTVKFELKHAILYSVIVVPVSTLNASTDQRPQTDYDADKADREGEGVTINATDTRKYLRINDNNPATITWQIKVGLASTYELAIRYNNPEDRAKSGVLQIIDDNGRLIQEESIEFDPSGGRWRTLKMNSATDINAGNYFIRLNFKGQEGLKIEKLSIR